MFPLLIPSRARRYSFPLPGLPVIISLWLSVLQLHIRTLRRNNLSRPSNSNVLYSSDSFHRLCWVSSEFCKGFFSDIRYRACVPSRSVVSDSATPRTAARQAPLPLGFSRQEYWSGVPYPPPGDRPNPGMEPRSPTMWADSLPAEPLGESSYLRYIHLSGI